MKIRSVRSTGLGVLVADNGEPLTAGVAFAAQVITHPASTECHRMRIRSPPTIRNVPATDFH